jgi:hypothetical protein
MKAESVKKIRWAVVRIGLWLASDSRSRYEELFRDVQEEFMKTREEEGLLKASGYILYEIGRAFIDSILYHAKILLILEGIIRIIRPWL